MTRNEDIIESFKMFYHLGALDGVAQSLSGNKKNINFEDRFKIFWENVGKNIFTNMKIKFEEEIIIKNDTNENEKNN